ncbi:hypothetical protein GCM10022253_31280 [Sphingomonas endophytica]
MTVSVTILLSVATLVTAQQLPPPANGGSAMAEVRASHVAANAPLDAEFGKLLERDVRAYLAAQGLPSRVVEIDLLRKGATQSGVSLPKYYLWVRASDGARQRVEGAMRVAAMERRSFEITHFTPAAAIRADPALLAAIYPALLIPAIRQHAGTP